MNKSAYLVPVCLVFLLSCKDPVQNVSTSATGTASLRQKLLTNYADQLIVPSYQKSLQSVDSLVLALEKFCAKPDTAQLRIAQNQFISAYTIFQHTNFYNFGPALDDFKVGLDENLNTFPASAARIEYYIARNDASFKNFERNTRGFPALDYLLFDSTGSVQNVTNSFRKTDSTFRRNYTLAVVRDIQTKLTKTKNDWNAYRDGFIKNDGTDAGSSITLVFNTMLKGFENTKNFRLGLPMGKRVPQTTPLPKHVEAYYSNLSTKLLIQNMKKTQDVWSGTNAAGVDGIGFDDYLIESDGQTLVNDTKKQFAAIQTSFTPWSSHSLAALIRNGDTNIETSLTEIQKLTQYIKSGLASKLSLTITFSSGDGD